MSHVVDGSMQLLGVSRLWWARREAGFPVRRTLPSHPGERQWAPWTRPVCASCPAGRRRAAEEPMREEAGRGAQQAGEGVLGDKGHLQGVGDMGVQCRGLRVSPGLGNHWGLWGGFGQQGVTEGAYREMPVLSASISFKAEKGKGKGGQAFSSRQSHTKTESVCPPC